MNDIASGTLVQITMEEIRAGDKITFSTADRAFTVRSIRDGMATGRGFRSTEGEYVKLPWGHKVSRVEVAR